MQKDLFDICNHNLSLLRVYAASFKLDLYAIEFFLTHKSNLS